jgi:hypothetical protein
LRATFAVIGGTVMFCVSPVAMSCNFTVAWYCSGSFVSTGADDVAEFVFADLYKELEEFAFEFMEAIFAFPVG